MALTKEEKKTKLKELEDKLEKQKSAVFVSVGDIKNKDILTLREKLIENDSDLTVSKKTMIKMAFSKKKIELNEDILQGKVALIFGYEDELIPSKLAYSFSKENKGFSILGGLLENNCIDKDKVLSLALLPPKEVLYSKVVYTMSAPLSGFLNVCKGSIRDLVSVLSKIN